MARCQVKTRRGARCKRPAKVCITYFAKRDAMALAILGGFVAPEVIKRQKHRHVCNGHRLKDRATIHVVRVAPIALCARKKPKQ